MAADSAYMKSVKASFDPKKKSEKGSKLGSQSPTRHSKPTRKPAARVVFGKG